MQRRTMLLSLAAAATTPWSSGQADADAIRAFVTNLYRTYSTSGNAGQYRALLAPEYLLLENGKVLDAAADVAGMPSPAAGARRSDQFEFRQVSVFGNAAVAVYVLRSVITDAKGTRNKAWLESMVLRQVDGQWRAALLHSTPLPE